MIELQKMVPWLGPEWIWVVKVFAVVLVTALASFFAKRLLNKIKIRLEATKTTLDDMLLKAMSRPIVWILWIIGLDVAADLILLETQSEIFAFSNSIRDVGVLVCIAWFFLNLVRGAEDDFVQRDGYDETTVQALGKLMRLVVLITASLVVLQTLGFSVSGVLAMGGIGGIAIGFAAKDMLANFFGGLFVYLDRPFTVGDWIRSPDREIEGTVENIGWRMTRIRNFKSQPIYVPNSVFTSIVVENPSRMNNRRIFETIGLRYSDLTSMTEVVDQVEKMLIKHEAIDETKTMMVNFNEFAGSSVDFFIYCFTETTQWAEYHQVKQDVLLRIAAIIEANHAEIAFPTSTLHVAEPIAVTHQ